ncbi:translation elongation factor Ts [Mycoplasmopsis felis]|uniref:translation elongation factor Ts n=1 Tax=Mycoplasmopsis felis TaxID=33923 RepID=UPI002AF6A440|nr:translation elongation factor Ts [Mycoplasmopsis felis]WQQ02044.1 translation elongation factor Ts [Mycoplasmopsis felis]
MAINKLELIKELRQRTNSALVDVKKALESTNYDIEAAVQWLKENGIVKAAKKAGRIAAEGAVLAIGNQTRAILIEINSETDFAAKNDKFVELLNQTANSIYESKVSTLEDALNVVLSNGQTVENELMNATSVIGEKISLRRVLEIQANEGEVLGIYNHINKQVSAVVNIKGTNPEVAKNVAMHVSAMNPEFSLVSQLSNERLNEIKSQFEKPAGFESKPAQIQEKIVSGWLDKQLSEFVLEKQSYVLDDALTVSKYLSSVNSELVNSYRFEVGEGIEKVQSNFAADVAEMVKH